MVVWSALVHMGALGLVLVTPADDHRSPPRVISVELLGSPPSAAPARPAPAAAKQKALPPPPAPPKPKQVVLPEKPQAPKPQAKEKAKPREQEVFHEPEKKEEKSLEELLAEMRDEAGEAETPAPAEAAEPVDTAIAPSPGSTSGTGDPLSPEERDWHMRVKRRMKGIWVVPPGFRTQALVTRVIVTLDASGNILGEPRITQRSGNPWFDEGVVRGLSKASPLPPPPEPGDWPMQFEPGDSL